jgi:uncharacterized membrane protein YheB (UPF0754 family)
MSNEYKALKLFNIKSFLSNGYSSDQYKLEILKFTTQNEANKLIESLTENAGLNRKLKEAQLNFNTKKPTWKERKWNQNPKLKERPIRFLHNKFGEFLIYYDLIYTQKSRSFNRLNLFRFRI